MWFPMLEDVITFKDAYNSDGLQLCPQLAPGSGSVASTRPEKPLRENIFLFQLKKAAQQSAAS